MIFLPQILMFVVKNTRFIFPVLLGLIVVLMVYGVYQSGHASGYTQGKDECQQQKIEAINENLRIKEKSDNIIRADGIALINRLHRGTY